MIKRNLFVTFVFLNLISVLSLAEEQKDETIPVVPQTTEAISEPAVISPTQPKGVPSEVSTAQFDEIPFRISLTAYYSTANTVIFNKVTASNGTNSIDGEITYNTNPALSLGASVAKIQKNNWGFSGSLFFETERKIESIKASDSTGSAVINNINSKFSLALLEGALNYRLNEIYFSAGLNFSIPMVQDGGTLKTSSKGDVGFSVGSGVFVNEKNSIDLLYRTVGVKMTGVNSATIYDFGTGYSQGLAIGWKYWL